VEIGNKELLFVTAIKTVKGIKNKTTPHQAHVTIEYQ
jgi:hypothetical protein